MIDCILYCFCVLWVTLGDVLLFLSEVFDSGAGKWRRLITKTFIIYVSMIM